MSARDVLPNCKSCITLFFLLVSPVADALAPFHLGRERIGCMKLCKSRTNWRRLYLPLPLSGLNSAFCPINRFSTRTTFLGKPEFLLIYCCQARFSAAKMPDQTAKIPDHVGWQFLTTAFIFRKGVFPQERRQFYCFWATAEISTIWRSRYIYIYTYEHMYVYWICTYTRTHTHT